MRSLFADGCQQLMGIYVIGIRFEREDYRVAIV